MGVHAQSQRRESLQFIPGRMHQQDALLDQAGTWLLQCRTTSHFDAGMAALLNVSTSGEVAQRKTRPPLAAVLQARSSWPVWISALICRGLLRISLFAMCR